jgi:hypothetical protein
MFVALIVLVIMLIGGLMVMRSINDSLLDSGNLAFQRDLTTRSDLVIAKVTTLLSAAGNLSTGGTAAGDSTGTAIEDLKQSQPTANYSAKILEANAQGIPKALLGSDEEFTKIGNKNVDMDAGGKVTIRYIIERMCNQEGPVSPEYCVQVTDSTDSMAGGGGTTTTQPGPTFRAVGVVYRLSARVSGPRATQTFFQATLSGPG